MTKFFRLLVFSTLFVAGLAIGPSAVAQKPSAPPEAPVPVQILTAKKVFLANAASRPIFDVKNLIWNEFYAGIKSAGRFQIVGTPEEADLVLEISHDLLFRNTPAEVSVRIVDPKTNVLLWQVWESVEVWNVQSTGRKNLDAAISVLVGDLTALATGPSNP